MKDYFDELAKLIDRYSDYALFGGSVADNIISAVEMRLNLKFPKSYRQFISKYAQGGFAGMAVCGISEFATEDNLSGSVIQNNDNLRKIEGVPKGILFIMIEDEYNVLIDTAQMENEEAPVYEIELGRGYETKNMVPVSKSFGEYFLKRVKEALDYLKEKGEIN